MSGDFLENLILKLLDGSVVTLKLLVLAGIFGNLAAVGIAVARVSHNPLLRLPAQGFIELIRGTPLLVQIYLFYYGLGALFAQVPEIRGSFLWPYLRDGFFYAVIALSVSTAAYSGEVLRGAILAVPRGEEEAARALGLSRFQILRLVILPRALRICLPTLGGETILLLKATALASTITVMDMMGVANFIRSQTFRVYEPLLAAAVIYIVMTFVLTRGFLWLERRLSPDRPAVIREMRH